VVAPYQLTMLVVLVGVGLNPVLEDLSGVVGRGAPIAGRMNMMDRLVSFIRRTEQVGTRANDNKGSNVVLRRMRSPHLRDKL
jgi:hypothetical protein